MPTITKEAEQALMGLSRQKSERIARLERQINAIREVAQAGIGDGDQHGTALWRQALTRIIQLTR